MENLVKIALLVFDIISLLLLCYVYIIQVRFDSAYGTEFRFFRRMFRVMLTMPVLIVLTNSVSDILYFASETFYRNSYSMLMLVNRMLTAFLSYFCYLIYNESDFRILSIDYWKDKIIKQ